MQNIGFRENFNFLNLFKCFFFNCFFKIIFKQFFLFFFKFEIFFVLTDVSNYCEERKTKLLINVYIKISRNLSGNFGNLGSNFLAFQ